MGPIATRRLLGRLRGRAAGLLVLASLAVVLVACQAQPPMGGAGEKMGMDMAPVMKMCAAVLGAIGAAVVAVAIGVLSLGRWKAVRVLAPSGLSSHVETASAVPRSDLLLLLCVSRR